MNSHRMADRETLQHAARILLRDGYGPEASALNATIEDHYPKPASVEPDAYTHTACGFHRCPCPSRCKPVGCIQHPNVEQQPLSLTP